MHQLQHVFLLVLVVGAIRGAPADNLPVKAELPEVVALPDVVMDLKGDLPAIEVPPPSTGFDVNGDDFPEQVMLADITDPFKRLEAAYKYCLKYGYIDASTEVNMDDMKAFEEAMVEPLKKAEDFFNLPIDGKLDDDLLDEMSQFRCGESDDASTAASRKKRWSQLGVMTWEDLPVTIKNRDWGRSLSQSEQTKALAHCAKLWGKNSGLTFKMVSGYEPANIEIVYKYIDGPWNTIGKGQSPVPFRNPATSYLTLDTSEKFKMSKDSYGQGVSLIWAICHEMGHTLGLSHSHDRDAIMYPSGNGQDESDLSYDDKKGIQALYGGPNGRDIEGGHSLYNHRDDDSREDHGHDRHNSRVDDIRRDYDNLRKHIPTPHHQRQPTYRQPTYTVPSPPRRKPSRSHHRMPHRRRYYSHSRRTPNYAPRDHIPRYRPTIPQYQLPTVRFG